jgi:hypothetical protein
MPFITLGAILTVLKIGGGHVLERRNDPSFWSVDIEPSGGERRKGEVTGVSLEATGLMLTVNDKGRDLALAAVPHTATKTKILIDGEVDADAAMVFDPKPSPGNLTRFAFDFKRVTIDGDDHRFNFRFDP